MTEHNQFERAWAEAMARIWSHNDEDFKKKLIQNPREAFEELGAKIPEGVNVRVIENDAHTVNFVIPPKPKELEKLTDQDLSELYRACPGTVCSAACSGTE